MFRARQLLVTTLVANLLVAGFVGAIHVHEHGGCLGGDCSSCVPLLDVPSVDQQATDSEPRCACEHDHGAAADSSVPPADEPVPHDHENCSVCQFLATAWLPNALLDLDLAAGLVELRPAETTEAPVVALANRPLPRGPPAA